MSDFFTKAASAGMRIGLNIVVPKSAELSDEDKIAALQNVRSVRILIVDADDRDMVLVDEIVPASTYKTGNVGYMLHQANVTFKEG